MKDLHGGRFVTTTWRYRYRLWSALSVPSVSEGSYVHGDSDAIRLTWQRIHPRWRRVSSFRFACTLLRHQRGRMKNRSATGKLQTSDWTSRIAETHTHTQKHERQLDKQTDTAASWAGRRLIYENADRRFFCLPQRRLNEERVFLWRIKSVV